VRLSTAAENGQCWGSGGQRSRSYEAKDRFGRLAEASFSAPLDRIAVLVFSTYILCKGKGKGEGKGEEKREEKGGKGGGGRGGKGKGTGEREVCCRNFN